MAYEIMVLWWWEPSADQIAKGMAVTPKVEVRRPRPKAIHLLHETFSDIAIMMFGTSAPQSSSSTPHGFPRSVELPSGQILFGITPSVSLDSEGLISGNQRSVEPTGISCPNKGFVISSAVTSASDTWDVQTEASR
jgi:hypothetical protein